MAAKFGIGGCIVCKTGADDKGVGEVVTVAAAAAAAASAAASARAAAVATVEV